MEHFGAEYDLSFEDYLSPFAPPTSRDTGPIPALSWEDDPFVSAEVTGLSPPTAVGEVASGRDPNAADSDHIPTASSTYAGAAAEQDELASEEGGVKVVNQLEQLAEEGPALLTAGLMESERWSDTAEQVAFREAVLAAHIARTKQRKGPAHPDLQPSDLAVVPGTKIKMATAAAAKAGELLQAANRAITDARSASGTDIGATVKVTAQSGYRGSEHQARLWRAYFTRYYNQTDRARQRLTGGPHSSAAVKYMLDVYRIPRRIAAPGYSNHQAGIAIDFRQVLKGTDRIRNSTARAAIERWRTTWFYRWLQQHAARFGFQPYTAEPWHWEYRPAGAQREQEAFAFEMEEPESESSDEDERWGPEEAEEPELQGWAETRQWEAGQSEDPDLDGWNEAGRWGTEKVQQPEFEPLGEEGRWGAEESEEPATNGRTEAQRWNGEDLEETEAFHGQVAGEAEEEGVDLVGQLFAKGLADNLEPAEGDAQKDPCDEKATPTKEHFEGEVEFDEFSGPEHKAIGDEGSGAALSSIAYGSPPQQLTFGEVVALAGDYFATYEEMANLTRDPLGRAEIAWARWDCLELKKQRVPEPPADEKQQTAVRERFLRLASRNLSHFSAGGTAWEAYTFWHLKAIEDAFEAGRRSDKALWQQALTKEAFGDHFLTDMFSAGHVRMPRAAIRDWYRQYMPNSLDHLVRYMARFMYDRLNEGQQLGNIATLAQWAFDSVTEKIEKSIRALGGEAINSFSLGDIIGLALHDYDNKGLQVVSDVDVYGSKVQGGHKWRAVGDAHLGTPDFGPKTKAMARMAVKASLRDLERVRDAGVKLGGQPASIVQKAAAIIRVLDGQSAARGFVPREDRDSTVNVPFVRADGGKSRLDWRWGQLGDVAYNAVDETVKNYVANKLSEMVNIVPEQVEGIHGVRNAFRSFIQHLRDEGITALVNAVGKPAG
jgi:hypothetical protein